MALLNRFSKLNDRGETGVFTFIVTKSVTRDFHRDATTKDFCFGYHRWAISFQRPTEKVLGVHLLLRNPSPNTACVVDFTLTLLNREHFSQNEVYSKRQAKFTITNPMQGVSRWIQMPDLTDKHFSNETGEFLFELSLSNMTTIFECDIQVNPATLTQYKSMLKDGLVIQTKGANTNSQASSTAQHNDNNNNIQLYSSSNHHHNHQQQKSSGNNNKIVGQNNHSQQQQQQQQLINLETNYFTFGAFDWSLTIVPLVIPSNNNNKPSDQNNNNNNNSTTSSSSSNNNLLLTPNKQYSNSNFSISSNGSNNPANTTNNNNNSNSNNINNCPTSSSNNNKKSVQHQKLEPVCRVYLNRLSGYDCLCRVKYRVILGHHLSSGSQNVTEFADSKLLDQVSDSGGRIRGHQFRNTNILKLISLRSSTVSSSANNNSANHQLVNNYHHSGKNNSHHHSATLDLRVHIEMFCANTISEAKVPLQRKPNEPQVSNCCDRNKQAWCVESDSENENVRLKLFFMDLQSVPRNHIRYISWIAYVVRRDSKFGQLKESIAVKNAPHSNYYLQDGMDMGTIMDTHIPVKELNESPKCYLGDSNQLTVHIEWVDSLLLFSHLYNNYDSLATIQRHQISRELGALQLEFEHLEKKYIQTKRNMNELLDRRQQHQQQQQQLTDGYSSNTDGGSTTTTNNSANSTPPLPGEMQHHHQQQQQTTTATPTPAGSTSSNNNNNGQQQQQQQPTTTNTRGSNPRLASVASIGSNSINQQQSQQQQFIAATGMRSPATAAAADHSAQDTTLNEQQHRLKLSSSTSPPFQPHQQQPQQHRRQLPQHPQANKLRQQALMALAAAQQQPTHSPPLSASPPAQLETLVARKLSLERATAAAAAAAATMSTHTPPPPVAVAVAAASLLQQQQQQHHFSQQQHPSILDNDSIKHLLQNNHDADIASIDAADDIEQADEEQLFILAQHEQQQHEQRYLQLHQQPLPMVHDDQLGMMLDDDQVDKYQQQQQGSHHHQQLTRHSSDTAALNMSPMMHAPMGGHQQQQRGSPLRILSGDGGGGRVRQHQLHLLHNLTPHAPSPHNQQQQQPLVGQYTSNSFVSSCSASVTPTHLQTQPSTTSMKTKSITATTMRSTQQQQQRFLPQIQPLRHLEQAPAAEAFDHSSMVMELELHQRQQYPHHQQQLPQQQAGAIFSSPPAHHNNNQHLNELLLSSGGCDSSSISGHFLDQQQQHHQRLMMQQQQEEQQLFEQQYAAQASGRQQPLS